MRTIIYFHGFGSSSASSTVTTLKKLLPDFNIVAPDIPVDPVDALPFLKNLCERENPDVVIGTSMGGMYAQQMRGYNRICVNPAFEMSNTSKVLKVGVFEYFKPRKDGQTKFEITEDIIRHYSEMEAHQFDGLTDKDRRQVWGLFGDNDQQVNCEGLFKEYYTNIIHFKGSHRLDENTIRSVLVPLILKITE